MKLKLSQLTGKAKVLGYVSLPIFVRTSGGELLQLEAEAYVVPDMYTEVLLGEDFHINYQIST